MADLEKAIAYVQHHGTLVEQAQLRYVLTGSTVSPEICAAFLKDQRPDGSWSAFWAPHAASIDATCYHLIQAEYMGLLAPMHPALARAIMFLQQRQSAEEYWEEDVQLRDVAPPWAMPGELADRVFSSLQKRLEGDVSAGNLVWLIASLHDARIPMKHPLLENATHLLEQKQKEDGRWESDDGPPFDVRTTLEVIRVMLLGK